MYSRKAVSGQMPCSDRAVRLCAVSGASRLTLSRLRLDQPQWRARRPLTSLRIGDVSGCVYDVTLSATPRLPGRARRRLGADVTGCGPRYGGERSVPLPGVPKKGTTCRLNLSRDLEGLFEKCFATTWKPGPWQSFVDLYHNMVCCWRAE